MISPLLIDLNARGVLSALDSSRYRHCDSTVRYGFTGSLEDRNVIVMRYVLGATSEPHKREGQPSGRHGQAPPSFNFMSHCVVAYRLRARTDAGRSGFIAGPTPTRRHPFLSPFYGGQLRGSYPVSVDDRRDSRGFGG